MFYVNSAKINQKMIDLMINLMSITQAFSYKWNYQFARGTVFESDRVVLAVSKCELIYQSQLRVQSSAYLSF